MANQAAYDKVLKKFMNLPKVDSDALDGTVAHLVYRAQHELDMLYEGHLDGSDEPFTARDQHKLIRFIAKYASAEQRGGRFPYQTTLRTVRHVASPRPY